MFDRSNRAGGLAFLDAEGKTQNVRNLQDENKTMGEMLAALRTIRAIKINPNTVKKIHAEGYNPGRKLSIVGKSPYSAFFPLILFYFISVCSVLLSVLKDDGKADSEIKLSFKKAENRRIS